MVVLSQKELVHRQSSIRKMLIPVALANGGPAVSPPKARNGSYIWAAHDGVSGRASEWRDWHFRSKNQGLVCTYYEIWNTVDRKSFALEQACFGLIENPTFGEKKELVGLHCDPSDTGEHSDFKRGPHIHVYASEQPFPHSHFALNYHQLNEVLRSPNDLFKALESGLAMIEKQVLDLLREE
jgi:hypothetical protein